MTTNNAALSDIRVIELGQLIGAREALKEVERPRRGKFRMQNAAPKPSGTLTMIRRLAPAVVGQDAAELERLRMVGAI